MVDFSCIIAGSRSVKDFDLVVRAIQTAPFYKDITEVVCGDAKGVDEMGALWATHLNIPVKHFPADWNNLKAKGAVVKTGAYGKYNAHAGHDRNTKMVEYADSIIAIVEGERSDIDYLVEDMQRRGKLVYVWEV